MLVLILIRLSAICKSCQCQFQTDVATQYKLLS